MGIVFLQVLSGFQEGPRMMDKVNTRRTPYNNLATQPHTIYDIYLTSSAWLTRNSASSIHISHLLPTSPVLFALGPSADIYE